jgi:hypothetical protein
MDRKTIKKLAKNLEEEISLLDSHYRRLQGHVGLSSIGNPEFNSTLLYEFQPLQRKKWQRSTLIPLAALKYIGRARLKSGPKSKKFTDIYSVAIIKSLIPGLRKSDDYHKWRMELYKSRDCERRAIEFILLDMKRKPLPRNIPPDVKKKAKTIHNLLSAKVGR